MRALPGFVACESCGTQILHWYAYERHLVWIKPRSGGGVQAVRIERSETVYRCAACVPSATSRRRGVQIDADQLSMFEGVE